MADEGVKLDQDKPRTDLLPTVALLGAAKVFAYGAAKYSARNWEKGLAYSRLYGALMRHVFAWWSGEENDPESGLPHLDHALCCLMMLRTMPEIHADKDDRPVSAYHG